MTKTESEMLYSLVQGQNVQIYMTEKRRLQTATVLRDACLVNVWKRGDFVMLKIRSKGDPADSMQASEVREVVKEWSKSI